MGRVRIVSGIDVIIAIMILIIGILVIIVGAGYLDEIAKMDARNKALAEQYSQQSEDYGYYSSTYAYTQTPLWTWAFPIFMIVLGIAALLYGIRRCIDNTVKIKENSPQQPIYRAPPNPPPQQPPNQSQYKY
jgi:hypothetical protein